MKILTVHNYYRQPGGEQAAVGAEIDLARSHGHDVVLYARHNSEIEHYGMWQKVVFFPQTVSSSRTRRDIQTLVTNEHPDLAHVHNVFPLVSPSVYHALKVTKLPIIQTVHNFRFICPNALCYTHGRVCEHCKRGHTWHAVRQRCYRESYLLSTLYALAVGLHRRWGTFEQIDRYIALTEFSARKLIESGLTTGNRVSVLGNFMPDPLPAPSSFRERNSYVIYVGRLSPEKGVEVLLKAMRAVPHLRLKILGTGPQLEVLQTTVRQQGLERVEFLGHVTGEQKWQLMRKALSLVIPSVWYENFPIVALESLAVGTPVIASDLGSLPHIVEDGKSGLLFQSGDAPDLGRKLAWLLAHPEAALAMGQYGRQVVQTHYSAQAHYERLMEIYAEVKH